MEDNNAQNLPINCANGCGFYGNPMNNNMCSKCFKEVSQKDGTLQDNSNTNTIASASSPTSLTEKPAAAMTTITPAPSDSAPSTPAPIAHPEAEDQVAQVSLPVVDSGASTPTSIASDASGSLAPGERAPQVNKGRCYLCRAKIPLAKQAINKCRCEFVFCDTHKATSKHDCDFDFAALGKDQLSRANPKLNDKPRGGRSFTRIQE